MKKIYLGGTENSKWREKFIDKLDASTETFIPDLISMSSKQASASDTILHVFTPESDNILETVELMLNLVKYPKRVIFTFFDFGGQTFNENQVKCLKQVGRTVDNCGGHWALTMLEVIHLLTSKEELC